MLHTSDAGIILPFNFFSTSSSPTYSKESDFEHDDSGREPIKEQALWQSVILQAIFDATHAPINQKTRREKTQAIIWLSITNKDFLFVCEMAGVDPKYIIHNAKLAIKRSTANHRRKQHMKRLRNKRINNKIDKFSMVEAKKAYP